MIYSFCKFCSLQVICIVYKEIRKGLVFEYPCFCSNLSFKGLVPVEMVRRKVQYGADMDVEFRYGLKLE